MSEQPSTENLPKSIPVFAPGILTEVQVALDFPVVFDGKTYSEIRVKRATIGEWNSYFEAMRSGQEVQHLLIHR